jgi:hypothetical protein
MRTNLKAAWEVRQGRARSTSSRIKEALRFRLDHTLGSVLVARELDYRGRLESDGSRVVTTDALTGELLEELFVEHTVAAIRIPDYFDRATAAQLSEWALEDYERWHLVDADGEELVTDMFYSMGAPFSSIRSFEDFERYFAGSFAHARLARDRMKVVSPLDRLRLELDEIWPTGARVATYEGLKMRPMIARVMTADGLLDGDARTQGICHCDASTELGPNRSTISAIAYLRVPDSGGELSVWNVNLRGSPFLQSYFYSLRISNAYNPGAQERLRAMLPPPVVITPRVGDLVLLNTGRPHAVHGFETGVRVTNQCFVEHVAGRPFGIFV